MRSAYFHERAAPTASRRVPPGHQPSMPCVAVSAHRSTSQTDPLPHHAGLSNRAIASVTGLSEPTVRRDQRAGASNDAPHVEAEAVDKPRPVVGTDGQVVARAAQQAGKVALDMTVVDFAAAKATEDAHEVLKFRHQLDQFD